MEALTRSRIPVLPLALLGLATMAQAQNFSYAYRTSASSTLQQVTPNSDIAAAPTGVSLTSSVTVVITNGSTATWTLSQVIVAGSAFKLTVDPGNTLIPPNSNALLTMTFTPTAPGNTSGTLGLSFKSGAQTLTQNFFLIGAGEPPNFITS